MSWLPPPSTPGWMLPRWRRLPSPGRGVCRDRPQSALADYLAVRGALGYKLVEDGRQLAGFVAYLDARGIDTVTAGPRSSGHQPPQGTRRSLAVYGRSRLRLLPPSARSSPRGPADPSVAGPVDPADPVSVLDDQIDTLLTTARVVTPAGGEPLSRRSSGCWGSRACGSVKRWASTTMTRPRHQVLTVHRAKFGRSRHVPITPTTTRPCPATWPGSGTPADPGARDPRCSPGPRPKVQPASRPCGSTRPSPPGRGHGPGPTCPSQLRGEDPDWLVRDGLDVHARLPRLSSYLGHVEPASTYWYLTATPELMALAADRLEAHTSGEGR